ncbi:MAG: glycosyltransferase family 2 protein [Actinomycetota bacterium]|nr:glycosyltransferase family 2 protein [Actinomycetota bacterium]
MVIDDSTGGLSIEERARALVRVATCGTPVLAKADLATMLPAEIMRAFTDASPAHLDDADHLATLAYRQWSAVFDHFAPVVGDVSITIASHRPRFIDFWLPQITQQVHRPVQVVVALHDTGFTEAERDRIRGVLGESGIDVVIVDVPSSKSLGATLDLARRRADGNVILKWDDDDLYGSNHVVDLLRARRYSGAPLVGKACDFVYVGSRDVTVRRHQADRETFSPTLSGNTLMIDREALDAVGGWSDVSLGEDASLIARVRRAGGNTYRTAGFGMIAVRHADPSRHTWNLDIESLVDGAIRTWSGLAPHAALVDVPTNVSDAVRRSAVGES